MATRALNETNLQNIQSNLLPMKSKQILSDSTNINSQNLETTSNVSNTSDQRVHSQRHTPLTPATILQHNEAIKRRDQANRGRVDPDVIKMLHDFQQFMSELSSSDEIKQNQMQQRASYNARQAQFLPFITDLDPSVLAGLYQTQNDLLIDLITLINNSNEDCSFFEQFQI